MAKTLAGQAFRTEKGLHFRVLEDRFFPRGQHDRANGKYLDSLREGYLVSAAYQGHPTPLVTLEDGVVKLGVVDVAGERVKGSRTIATRLGVAETRRPVKLERA